MGYEQVKSTNPKDKIGKLKPSIHLIPPVALIEEAVVFGLGASKYGPYNWRSTNVSAEMYVSAALRHILSWQDRQDIDPESGSTHLAHARACLAILIDAESEGRLVDDRPPGGTAAALIIRRTQTGRTSGVGETTAGGLSEAWIESMGDLIPANHPEADPHYFDDTEMEYPPQPTPLTPSESRRLDDYVEEAKEWRAGDEHDTPDSYFDDELPLPPADPTGRWVHRIGLANPAIAYIERDGLTLTYYRHDGTISSVWQDTHNDFSRSVALGYYQPYYGPLVKLDPVLGAAFEAHCAKDSDACGCGVPFLTVEQMVHAIGGLEEC